MDIRFDQFTDPDSSRSKDIKDELILAHRHSAAHKSEVMRSDSCGCFSCCAVFAPADIEEWIEETGGSLALSEDPWTAVCPKCGIDAVIGTASGYPVERAFLQKMNTRWFRSA